MQVLYTRIYQKEKLASLILMNETFPRSNIRYQEGWEHRAEHRLPIQLILQDVLSCLGELTFLSSYEAVHPPCPSSLRGMTLCLNFLGTVHCLRAHL